MANQRSLLNNSRLSAYIKNKTVRQSIAIFVIGITIVAFALYIVQHPDSLAVLTRLSPLVIVGLTVCYLITIAANAIVLTMSLRLVKKPVSFIENILLTSYSSIINFFGPLQSGPGVRAVYLKKRHGVSLRQFAGYTLLFYAFFGVFNLAILLVGFGIKSASIGITLTITGIVLLLFVALASTKQQWQKKVSIPLSRYTLGIFFGAVLLSLATAAAYFIELHTVTAAISIGQALLYAAAANLALFVSLTPGAIGFRESFLLFSQRLHDIPTNVIVQASIIDRGFYVCFLAVLFLVVLALSARYRSFKIR